MFKKTKPEDASRAGLPVRDFLFTLDQVAALLQVRTEDITKYVRMVGSGKHQPPTDANGVSLMAAHNVSPSALHDQPEWRVTETELIIYLKARGIHIYERKFR